MTAPSRTAPHPLLTIVGMTAVLLLVAAAFWGIGFCLAHVFQVIPGAGP